MWGNASPHCWVLVAIGPVPCGLTHVPISCPTISLQGDSKTGRGETVACSQQAGMGPNTRSPAQERVASHEGKAWVSRKGVGLQAAEATQAERGLLISREHARCGTHVSLWPMAGHWVEGLCRGGHLGVKKPMQSQLPPCTGLQLE